MNKLPTFLVLVFFFFGYSIDANAKNQQPSAPNLTAIVRNGDGSIRSMNQMDATQYCHSRGLRLPTIRELALYAQAQGAEGISKDPQDGYHPVEVRNENGKIDRFYYSPSGYRRPRGDLGYGLYWSSSFHISFANQGYALHGYHGGMVYEYQTVFGGTATRCLSEGEL